MLSFTRLLSALVIPLLISSAFAGEEGGGKKPEPGTTVEMPYLVVPMSTQDGKLLGYTYVTSKLVCSSGDAAMAAREKLGFIQDGVVREVNARPLGLPDDPKTIDKAQLNARLTAVAKRIVGDKKVVSMVFIDIKYSPLHPSDQTDIKAAPPEEPADAKKKPKEGGEGEGKKDEGKKEEAKKGGH
jgi:hypothetical protein